MWLMVLTFALVWQPSHTCWNDTAIGYSQTQNQISVAKVPSNRHVLPLWRSFFSQTTKPKCGSFKHIESSSYQMCADNDTCSHSVQFKNHTSANCQHALVCSDTSGIRWTSVCLICCSGNIETWKVLGSKIKQLTCCEVALPFKRHPIYCVETHGV
jgi:hypothetical protein